MCSLCQSAVRSLLNLNVQFHKPVNALIWALPDNLSESATQISGSAKRPSWFRAQIVATDQARCRRGKVVPKCLRGDLGSADCFIAQLSIVVETNDQAREPGSGQCEVLRQGSLES